MTDAHIRDAVTRIAVSYPALANVASRLRLRGVDNLPTYAGIDADCRMVYSPTLMDRLNDDEVTFVLMHEMFHVLLRHHARFEAIEAGDVRLWNYAIDMPINHNLSKALNVAIDGMVTPSTVHAMCGVDADALVAMSAEEIYAALMHAAESAPQGVRGKGDDGGESQGQNDGDGQGDMPAPLDSLDGRMGEIIDEAFADDGGDGPMGGTQGGDGMESPNDREVIAKALAGRPNWKSLLFDAIDAHTRGRRDRRRTWRTPSRKYRDIYPMTKGRRRLETVRVLLSVDCSGSMDAERVSMAAAAADDIAKHLRVDVDYRFFAVDVTEPARFGPKRGFDSAYQAAECGGGTRYEAAATGADGYALNIVVSDCEFDHVPTHADGDVPIAFVNVGRENGWVNVDAMRKIGTYVKVEG